MKQTPLTAEQTVRVRSTVTDLLRAATAVQEARSRLALLAAEGTVKQADFAWSGMNRSSNLLIAQASRLAATIGESV